MTSRPESYREALFKEVLPRTVRYSTVLHLHAAIDALLSKLCDHVQKSLQLRFSRSDMANPWAIRSRLEYLRKALGDDLAPEAFAGPFHQKLADVSRVRDCIAHAGGEFGVAHPKKSSQVRQAAARLGFSNEGTHLVVPSGLIDGLIHEARAWTEDACAAVETALGLIKGRARDLNHN